MPASCSNACRQGAYRARRPSTLSTPGYAPKKVAEARARKVRDSVDTHTRKDAIREAAKTWATNVDEAIRCEGYDPEALVNVASSVAFHYSRLVAKGPAADIFRLWHACLHEAEMLGQFGPDWSLEMAKRASEHAFTLLAELVPKEQETAA